MHSPCVLPWRGRWWLRDKRVAVVGVASSARVLGESPRSVALDLSWEPEHVGCCETGRCLCGVDWG